MRVNTYPLLAGARPLISHGPTICSGAGAEAGDVPCAQAAGRAPAASAATGACKARRRVKGFGPVESVVMQVTGTTQNFACSPTVTVRAAPGATHTRLYELV